MPMVQQRLLWRTDWACIGPTCLDSLKLKMRKVYLLTEPISIKLAPFAVCNFSTALVSPRLIPSHVQANIQVEKWKPNCVENKCKVIWDVNNLYPKNSSLNVKTFNLSNAVINLDINLNRPNWCSCKLARWKHYLSLHWSRKKHMRVDVHNHFLLQKCLFYWPGFPCKALYTQTDVISLIP